MNKLIVLSGVPGSGKSYFSKAVKKMRNSHVYVVSSDELRKEITGSQSNLTAEELVWKLFYSLVDSYSLDKDGIVIMDATHTSSHLRVDKNIQFKDKFDEIDLVMWNIDRDIVMNQNFQRDYPIPIEAMEKFFEIFELPTQKDYDFFDKVLLVANGDLAHVLKELNI